MTFDPTLPAGYDPMYWGSLEAPASALWLQDGDGLSPLADSPHAEAALAIKAGAAPSATRYSALCREFPYRSDGSDGAAAIAGLLVALAARAWEADPIRVAINDVGQIVITDGLHRAAAALALGLPVPCEIVYRHERWQALRRAMHALNGGPKLYQAIDHPDFAYWQQWRTDTAARATIVAKVVRRFAPKATSGIDYACNSGALTCALARAGFEMRGVDLDPNALEAARRLATMHFAAPATFHLVDEPLPRADFLCVFSLLNHHQTDGRDAEGRALFRRLCAAAPLVFLDAPVPGDPVGGASPFTDPAHVLAWCRSTVPGKGEVVQTSGLMRPLLLWRPRP